MQETSLDNKTLDYRGFSTVVKQDYSGFFGKVTGGDVPLHFHSRDASGVVEAFQDTVDSYLEFCHEMSEGFYAI